jgi:sugar-specific transcriptional regulator TrmB
MIEEILPTLKRIGLTNNESKVYYSLVRIGESKAGAISKKTGINRTTTYDSLKGLIDKGLVSFVVKANKKFFSAVDPDRLLDFIKEKEIQAERIIPTLKKIYEKPQASHNVTLYHGYKGMKSVFQDFIKSAGKNGVIYVMDSEGQFIERMPYYAPHFIRQLEQDNIKVKHVVRKGRDIKPSKTTEVRFIEKLGSDAVIDIYEDKVAILIWTDPPEAVVIENKTLSDSMKFYFEIIWNSIKK